jgi:spore maturation protein CgeB
MGPAGHRFELNKIYSGTLINLEINRLYQPDMINMRVFDIMACGGFLLAEYTPELADLFRLDQELVVYHTKAELMTKAQHYLLHPAEARAIAAQGLQAVREKHTIRKRVEYMLQASQVTP